jgi:rhomboid protease GluP
MDMEPNNRNPQQQPAPVGAPRQQLSVRVTLPTVQPILVYIILGLIVLVFLYSQSLSTDSVPDNLTNRQESLMTYVGQTLSERDLFLAQWAKINDLVYEEGEYYRLFTSMFLHLDFVHILFNAYALYLFGRDVEGLFGHIRFAIVYILGGLAGSVGSLLYTDAWSIGASGAIFAVFGAMGVYLYQHRHFYGEVANRRLTQMAFLGVVNIIFGLAPGNRIDNAAHIGGLVGGIVLAWFIAPEFELKRDETDVSPTVTVVDTNTPAKWIIVPVLFAVGLIASVVYASSVLG